MWPDILLFEVCVNIFDVVCVHWSMFWFNLWVNKVFNFDILKIQSYRHLRTLRPHHLSSKVAFSDSLASINIVVLCVFSVLIPQWCFYVALPTMAVFHCMVKHGTAWHSLLLWGFPIGDSTWYLVFFQYHLGLGSKRAVVMLTRGRSEEWGDGGEFMMTHLYMEPGKHTRETSNDVQTRQRNIWQTIL